MEKKSIFIDIELFKFLEQNRQTFDEDYNDILKRLLLKNTAKKETNKNVVSQNGLHWKGTFFKDGLKLRGFYKGMMLDAIVKNGKINYNGQEYTSPSAAAIGATGMNMSGWSFWEYFDEKKNKWILISDLKNN